MVRVIVNQDHQPTMLSLYNEAKRAIQAHIITGRRNLESERYGNVIVLDFSDYFEVQFREIKYKNGLIVKIVL